MVKELWYRIVLYDTEEMLPYKFDRWEAADDFIFKNNLHAYITIRQILCSLFTSFKISRTLHPTFLIVYCFRT